MRIEEAMAAASRAALDCGASCSEAARALGAGMAALGLGTSRFDHAEQARAEEQRALADLRAGAAEAQRKIERKLIAMGREALMAELAELDVRLRGAHADRIIIDDLVEPAPTIDRMPHSGASADLVLRELGLVVLPSPP